MRHCGHCGQVKPLEAFYRNRGLKDGRQYGCSSCEQLRRAAARSAKRPPPLPSGFKRCNHCREVKPVEDFNRVKAHVDGRNYTCRACHKAEWRAAPLRRAWAQLQERRRGLSD